MSDLELVTAAIRDTLSSIGPRWNLIFVGTDKSTQTMGNDPDVVVTIQHRDYQIDVTGYGSTIDAALKDAVRRVVSIGADVR